MKYIGLCSISVDSSTAVYFEMSSEPHSASVRA